MPAFELLCWPYYTTGILLTAEKELKHAGSKRLLLRLTYDCFIHSYELRVLDNIARNGMNANVSW